MSHPIRYIYNDQTQSFEVDRISARATIYRTMAVLLGGIACFLVYFFVFTQARNNATPKERLLQHENRILAEQIGMLESRMEAQDAVLLDLSLRDNLVYRPVFGMEEIPAEERNAGLGNASRYDSFLGFDHAQLMEDAARRVDILTRKAYVQSVSFDEVKVYSSRAGDMASCIPSIYPVNPKTVQMTSPFGARYHPIRQAIVFHEGVDLAGAAGQPVYATGDGVVESTQINFSGYGNVIVIDHGFGYKTRYAHLKEINVTAGQVVIRGDKIGTLGSSGLSTGPHLHYEVIYRGTQINPWNYLNPDISPEEYNKQARHG